MRLMRDQKQKMPLSLKIYSLVVAISFIAACGSDNQEAPIDNYYKGKIFFGDSKSQSVIRNSSESVKASDALFDKMICVYKEDFKEILRTYSK